MFTARQSWLVCACPGGAERLQRRKKRRAFMVRTNDVRVLRDLRTRSLAGGLRGVMRTSLAGRFHEATYSDGNPTYFEVPKAVFAKGSLEGFRIY